MRKYRTQPIPLLLPICALKRRVTEITHWMHGDMADRRTKQYGQINSV